MAGNEELLKKVSSLEIENKSLKKGNISGWILFSLSFLSISMCKLFLVANLHLSFHVLFSVTDDLKNLVIKLENRVSQLEKGKGGSAPAPAKVEEEEDDDDVDLFGSDSEDEEAKAEKVRTITIILTKFLKVLFIMKKESRKIHFIKFSGTGNR